MACCGSDEEVAAAASAPDSPPAAAASARPASRAPPNCGTGSGHVVSGDRSGLAGGWASLAASLLIVGQSAPMRSVRGLWGEGGGGLSGGALAAHLPTSRQHAPYTPSTENGTCKRICRCCATSGCGDRGPRMLGSSSPARHRTAGYRAALHYLRICLYTEFVDVQVSVGGGVAAL